MTREDNLPGHRPPQVTMAALHFFGSNAILIRGPASENANFSCFSFAISSSFTKTLATTASCSSTNQDLGVNGFRESGFEYLALSGLAVIRATFSTLQTSLFLPLLLVV